MQWNWQQPDWPQFSWHKQQLRGAEERFLVGGGVILGAVEHLGKESREELVVGMMSEEALTSSEIEGEVLDRASVQSSIRRQLDLEADSRRASPAERGMAEMTTSLYRTWDDPLEEETLWSWHRMLMRGRTDLSQVGAWRADEEPMQVVSGSPDAPRVHFEAPPSSRVAEEMLAFVHWFNRTAPDGADPMPALTRTGVAHLYFESIHPFEDGNGRIGRAISEKALAQGLERPTQTALAATILARCRAYYRMLETSNRHNDIDAWVAWFAGITLEAQQKTRVQVEFLIEKTKLLDRLRGDLNERQEKVLLRVLAQRPEGFEGGLSAGNYVRIAHTSPATARRDLADLVDKGAFRRTGERRYARYHLTISLRPTAAITIDHDGNVVEEQRDRE